MKKIIFVLAASGFIACGERKDGTAMAKEICDCYENKGDDCTKLFFEAGKKIMNNKKKTDEFNRAMKECTMYLIKLPKRIPHQSN
ncbi:MAG: hypothetical protein H7Y01_02770 [Ferruginibacter sp.]|nr:hypothetical protein [Chitinophagaceae bacterium]